MRWRPAFASNTGFTTAPGFTPTFLSTIRGALNGAAAPPACATPSACFPPLGAYVRTSAESSHKVHALRCSIPMNSSISSRTMHVQIVISWHSPAHAVIEAQHIRAGVQLLVPPRDAWR